MRTIAVINQKGGCGKTTTAINLAASLAELGRRVLLVDLDPQGHASLGLSIRSDEVRHTVYNALLAEWMEGHVDFADVILTLSGNLHLAPANIMLSAIEQQLAGVDGREDRLRTALAGVAERYDYTLIDSPPGVGLLTFNALRAATAVLVPVETGFFSMHGLAKLLETVAVVNDEYAQGMEVRVLPTMYEARHRIAREVLAELRRTFGDRVFRTVVRVNVRLREAASFGLPITEFDPGSLGAKDYLGLAREFTAMEEWREVDVARVGGAIVAAPETVPDVAPAAPEPAPAPLMGEPPDQWPAIPEVTLSREGAAGAEPVVAEPVVSAEAAGGLFTVVHPAPAEADSGASPAAEPVPPRRGVLFTFRAPGARTVQIAGDFNNWTPEGLDAEDLAQGVWKRVIPLSTGRYRYRFVVDNTWLQDCNNPDAEECPYGGYNSVVTVA